MSVHGAAEAAGAAATVRPAAAKPTAAAAERKRFLGTRIMVDQHLFVMKTESASAFHDSGTSARRLCDRSVAALACPRQEVFAFRAGNCSGGDKQSDVDAQVAHCPAGRAAPS